MSKPNERLQAIFEVVLALESDVQRNEYLERACPDAELRSEVEALLAAHANPDSIFVEKAVGVEVPPSEKTGEMIGRYKLLEKLGEGGFGSVWLSEQKEPIRRKVALKVIKLGMDTRQVVARFEAERQTLALMDHPNIAKVLDAGSTDRGRPYFVMELVRGIPITRFCNENKLTTEERLDLFSKVCHAVQHAHQKGTIHRDLKPSNVLVTLHDGVPVPKVIDFGIAKATQQEMTDKTVHTMFQQFIGTPAYVSPEQAEMSGLDIDTRSDIYSLGVLLYELLTGVTPFSAQVLLQSGLDEMRRIIREEEPKRPSTRLSTLEMAEATALARHRREKLPALIHLVRGDLDWIVMKCLEKDRTRRYETASGLAADLKRHLHNEPVTARPPSKLYEFQKTVRRHKLGFAAAAAIILVLVVGVAVSTWQAVRARRAESKALQAQQNEARLRETADERRDEAQRAREDLEESLYLNNMSLAHWNLTHEPPNIVEAEQLLDSCKPELRGWEWNYLKDQWLIEPFVLRDPGKQGYNSVSFSSNDRYLASAGVDGQVTVWDIVTQKPLRSFVAHTNGFAFCVAFDPTDSTRLVSAGKDNQVKLWEWNTTNLLHSWPIQFSFQWGMAYAIAFSPDGQRVAAAAGKAAVTVWSATTGEELFSIFERREESRSTVLSVFSLAFSPDGQRLATGGGDGIVCVWDARTRQANAQGDRLIRKLGRFTNPIAGVAFSKGDGRMVTAAGFDSSVMVFDVESGQMLWRWRAHGGQSIHAHTLSPDNKRLVTGAADRTVKLWDMNWSARTNHEVLTFRDFTREVQCATFSHDGRRLAACSRDGTIKMWDATQGIADNRECLLTVNQGMEVRSLNLRRDGLMFASGGERLADEQGGIAPIFIRNSRTGQLLRTISRDSLYLFSADFSPDGRFLVATGDDRDYRRGYTMQIWASETGDVDLQTEPFPGEGCVFSAGYSFDGRRLFGGAQDGRLLVWDATTGRRICELGKHDGAVFNLVLSPNGRYLASAAHTGQVRIWDATRLDAPQTNFIEIGPVVGEISDTLAFSPDSRRLVVATDDQIATVWDIENRTNALSLRSESIHGFRAVAFSTEGRWIASGGTDCKVKVWDTRTGELLHTFRGHKGEILRVRFFQLPDGLRLISGGRDGTIMYWDLQRLQSTNRDAAQPDDKRR